MKNRSLMERLVDSGKKFIVGTTLLASSIIPSYSQSKPLEIQVEQDGTYSSKQEMTIVTKNSDNEILSGTPTQPIYFNGKFNTNDNSILISYSTFPLREQNPPRPIQDLSNKTGLYLILPAGVRCEVEWQKASYLDRNGTLQGPIDLEPLDKSGKTRNVIGFGTELVDLARNKDPLEKGLGAITDAINTLAGTKLNKERTWGIYGSLVYILERENEQAGEQRSKMLPPGTRINQVDIYPLNNGIIGDLSRSIVARAIKLRLLSEDSAGKTIPVAVYLDTIAGDQPMQTSGGNISQFGQGRLETITTFEFGNSSSVGKENKTNLSGIWRYLIGNGTKIEKEIYLEVTENSGGKCTSQAYSLVGEKTKRLVREPGPQMGLELMENGIKLLISDDPLTIQKATPAEEKFFYNAKPGKN